MEYPWAVENAKVQYIGPDMLKLYSRGVPKGLVPSPLSKDAVYTIRTVFMYQRALLPALILQEFNGVFFVVHFRPLASKDAETFNAILHSIPKELVLADG